MRADPVHVCERHGLEHRTRFGGESCHGHSKRAPHKCCTNAPRPGAVVCHKHGAKAGQVARAADRRLAVAEVADSIRDVVVEPIGNPLDALAELAADATAWRKHLASMVAELDQYRFTADSKSEQLDARVALFERSMDRCQRFLADWVRLGFEERKARLDDARVTLVQAMVVGVLADLGRRLEEPEVRAALERWVPVLDGQPAPPALSRRAG